MGFNKIFNWLRFITLPPSYLFNNRLFIERNSRNKKIFNNFGWTYKSNVWSKQKTKNLDFLLVKKTTLNYIGVVALVVLVYIYYANPATLFLFISGNPAVHSVYFFFWRVVDYFSFFLFHFCFIGVTFLVSLYTKLFSFIYPNFQASRKLNQVSYLNYSGDALLAGGSNKFLLNYLYKNNKYLLLENLFSTTTPGSPPFLLFYKKLFKVNYLLQLTKLQKSRRGFKFLTKDISVVLNYELQLKKLNLKFKKPRWELSSLVRKESTLFIHKLTFSTWNKLLFTNRELFFLNTKFINYFKKFEYFKWLYKYSIIHSRSLHSLDTLNLKSYNLGLLNTTFQALPQNSIYNYYNASIQQNLLLTSTLSRTLNPGVGDLFKSSLELANFNSYNNWVLNYKYLSKSFSWLLIRTKLLNKPNFNNLKLVKKALTVSTINNGASLGAVTCGLINDYSYLTLLYNATQLDASSVTFTPGIFEKADFILNVQSSEFFNILDKNLIYLLSSSSYAENNQFSYYNILQFNGDLGTGAAPKTDLRGVFNQLVLTKLLTHSSTLLNLYYFYI